MAVASIASNKGRKTRITPLSAGRHLQDTDTLRLLPGNDPLPFAPEQHTPARNTLLNRHVHMCTHAHLTPCTPTILPTHSHTTCCHRLTSTDCSTAAGASRIKPSPRPPPLCAASNVHPHNRMCRTHPTHAVGCDVWDAVHKAAVTQTRCHSSYPCQAWN